MDTNIFTEMLKDKHSCNFTKLKYKYGERLFSEYISSLNSGFYQSLPIHDFDGNPLVFLPSKIQLTSQATKVFMQNFQGETYGVSAMEDEIISTLSIEQIDSTRENVRNILNGGAPKDENDNKAYGIKRGLDFIADASNRITEENLYNLYMLTVGDFLEESDRPLPGYKYRHDTVYVVGSEIKRQGLDCRLLPSYVAKLIEFINAEDDLDHIIKSIICHYYISYLHPYFDGNGRMARLLQMWVLIRKGFSSSLFLPFSLYINKTKSKYYKAFEQIIDNNSVSGILDVTPFIDYFVKNVLTRLNETHNNHDILEEFNKLLKVGEITEKEKKLFQFVLSHYGTNSFSTKQLEKDYRDVAYATVRAFVLKLEGKGLLLSQKYGNRVKYRVTASGNISR